VDTPAEPRTSSCTRSNHPDFAADIAEEARRDGELAAALDRLRGLGSRRLLVIHEHFPRFDASGSDLRLLRILEVLRACGHQSTFIGRGQAEHERYRARLEAMGIRAIAPDPDKLRWYADVKADTVDLRVLLRRQRFDAAILFNWFWTGISVAEQYLPEIRAYAPGTAVAVLSDDVHWYREERLARLSGKRLDLERSRGIRAKEREIYQRSDLVLAITEEDRDRMRTELPSQRILRLRHACRPALTRGPPFEARSGLLFVGSGGNQANQMAVEWFLKHIWPDIRERLPGSRFRIVGPPPADGWPLAGGNEGVDVVGQVDSLDPYLNAARVFVSPITFGTGLKTKNVEALAAGLPLVTTRVGAEGMCFFGEEVAFVRDDPSRFAEAVARLHSREEVWKAASEVSLEHARKRFGLRGLVEDLAEALALLDHVQPGSPSGGGTLGSLRVEELWPEILRQPVEVRLSARLSAHVALARRLREEGCIEDALRELRYILVICSAPPDWPGYASVFFSLGLLYRQNGQLGEARESLEEALRLDPSSARARHLLRSLRR
jgi:glycosyltransferase involved in cell wall biosynthesis